MTELWGTSNAGRITERGRELLCIVLETQHWSQKELSIRLGVSPCVIHRIANGKREKIDSDLALKLERVTGIPWLYWRG